MQSIREPGCLTAVQSKIVTPNYFPFVSFFLSIVPRPPIGKGNIPVKLAAGCDKRLPTIYKTSNHPKYNGPGRIFYFLQNLRSGAWPDLKSRSKCLTEVIRLQSRKASSFTLTDRHCCLLYYLGFLHLQEDDIVFIRGLTLPESGVADVPCCWVTGG